MKDTPRVVVLHGGCLSWLDCTRIFCSVALAGGETTCEVL